MNQGPYFSNNSQSLLEFTRTLGLEELVVKRQLLLCSDRKRPDVDFILWN